MTQDGCASSSHYLCSPQTNRKEEEMKGTPLPLKDVSWKSHSDTIIPSTSILSHMAMSGHKEAGKYSLYSRCPLVWAPNQEKFTDTGGRVAVFVST